MDKNLVIFGAGNYAKQVHHYFSSGSGYRVGAFTVDAAFVGSGSFCGLPVIPFDDVVRCAPPDAWSMFIAVGYDRVNETRQLKYEAARQLGYRLASYVHPTAVVAAGVAVGDNSLIGELTVVKPFARLGVSLQIGAQVYVGHDTVVGDHSYLAARSTLCGHVDIGERCFIGANATVRDRVKVGARCVVGAGAVILGHCAPDGVYRAAATPRLAVGSGSLSGI